MVWPELTSTIKYSTPVLRAPHSVYKLGVARWQAGEPMANMRFQRSDCHTQTHKRHNAHAKRAKKASKEKRIKAKNT